MRYLIITLVDIAKRTFHDMLKTGRKLLLISQWKLKCRESVGGLYQATQPEASHTGSVPTSRLFLLHLVRVGQQVHPEIQQLLQQWHGWHPVCFLPSPAVPERKPEGTFPHGTNPGQSELLWRSPSLRARFHHND